MPTARLPSCARENLASRRRFRSGDQTAVTLRSTPIPPDRVDEEKRLLAGIRRGESVVQLETVRRTKDGRLIEVSITASPIRDASGRVVGSSKIARDVTAMQARGREIARLTRLYAALSQVNQVIVLEHGRDELFRKICRILVEQGGFRMAWIGWHDPATRTLSPVAAWGDDDDYLRTITVSVDERLPEGQGSIGAAFREVRPYLSNDLLEDPAGPPWRSQAERLGFRASAVFPICENGRVYAMVGDREKSLAAGCNGYIEKPIDPDTLVAEIQRVVDVVANRGRWT